MNLIQEYRPYGVAVTSICGMRDPRGTSQEFIFGELDRDYNASLNILAM